MQVELCIKEVNVFNSGSSTEQATLQLMAYKMVEGMTNLQRQILENKDAETVRGQQELPSLPEWTASSGPVACHD